MKATVTRENNEGKREFYHISKLDSRKEPMKVRRNGATKYWKTRPNEFKIPVKYGLYEYGYIDQNNAAQWTID